MVSQFHRFSNILLRRSDFVEAIADVVFVLYGKGYDADRMMTLVYRQCKHHSQLYGTAPRHLFLLCQDVLRRKMQR